MPMFLNYTSSTRMAIEILLDQMAFAPSLVKLQSLFRHHSCLCDLAQLPSRKYDIRLPQLAVAVQPCTGTLIAPTE